MKKEKVEQKEFKVPVADKNYRMSKPLKRMLALGFFKTKKDRNSWKNFAIDAEVQAKSQERAVFDKLVGKKSADEAFEV